MTMLPAKIIVILTIMMITMTFIVIFTIMT